MYGKWLIENLGGLPNKTTTQESSTPYLIESFRCHRIIQPDLGLKNYFEICIKQLLESHQET